MTSPAVARHRPFRTEDVPQWDFEADVIVIGLGGAGTCAAIEAASAGAKVLAFEAASEAGGTSAMSGGEVYIGGNGGTHIQKAAGFEDSTEDFRRYLTIASGQNLDQAKVDAYAEGALGHFEWLQAKGIPFKNSFVKERIVEPTTDDCLLWSGSETTFPYAQEAKPCPRGHTTQFVGLGGGSLLMKTLLEHADELGVKVECNARAIALVTSAQGEVQGVVVKISGNELFAKAHKGVVLTTGGFIMNSDMVKKNAPDLLRAEELLGGIDDGSGILLGQSVGGETVNMSEGFTTVPWYPPESLIFGIMINEKGQRFINEDGYHGRTARYLFDQPTDRNFLLVDGSCYGESIFREYTRIDIAGTGETWEEVEQELGLVEGSLVSTVNLYNKYAEQGEDPLYHKSPQWVKPLTEPPFVAMDFTVNHCLYSAFTLGGLNTLASGEVLTAQNEVIPGLYAAGRTSCGIARWGKGYSSGMSLGDATFFGRQAGIAAANRSGSE